MIKIIKEDRDPKDDIAWDLLDYITERLMSEIEDNLALKASSDVTTYDASMAKEEINDQSNRELVMARKKYVLALIKDLIDGWE